MITVWPRFPVLREQRDICMKALEGLELSAIIHGFPFNRYLFLNICLMYNTSLGSWGYCLPFQVCFWNPIYGGQTAFGDKSLCLFKEAVSGLFSPACVCLWLEQQSETIELVMPSNHLILCHLLLLLPSIFPSIRVFSNESVLHIWWSKCGDSDSASILPMNIQGWSPLGWTDWISLQSKGLSRVFSNTTLQKHQFIGTQCTPWSNSHFHTWPLEKP